MTDRPLLVLGATSLVGRPLLSRLAQDGRPVAALSRADREPVPGVTWLRGTLADPAWVKALPSVTAALSLSPIWLLPPSLPALSDAGLSRLVAFSSTSRFTKTDSPVAAEREVARTLAEAEDALIAACEARGVAWTILRPTLIYDEGRDGNITRLAALIRRFGVIPLAGQGAGLRQPVHAADLADAALAALDAAATHGRAYNLPGGETLSYRAMATRVFEGLDRPPRILTVPRPLWRLGFALTAPLLPGTTAAMGDRMDADMTFDPGPAVRDFGWSPRRFHPRFV